VKRKCKNLKEQNLNGATGGLSKNCVLLSDCAIKKRNSLLLRPITIYKFLIIKTIVINLQKIPEKMYNKIKVMEKYLIYVLAGFIGGIIRSLVGFVKNKTIEKADHFKPSYFIVTILISGIVGAAAGALADTEWQVSFLAGYAGTDFIENLYKIKLEKGGLK
jgi:hypothetical protein